jgi:hypothetical protein
MAHWVFQKSDPLFRHQLDVVETLPSALFHVTSVEIVNYLADHEVFSLFKAVLFKVIFVFPQLQDLEIGQFALSVPTDHEEISRDVIFQELYESELFIGAHLGPHKFKLLLILVIANYRILLV